MRTTSSSGQITWPLGIKRGSQLLEVDETQNVASTIRSVIQSLERRPLLAGAVIAFLLLCALSMVLGTATGLVNFRR